MKKLLLGVVAILIVVGGLFGTQQYLATKTGSDASSDKVLNLYNWGDYLDPDLMAKFTKETGYQISYETFDSNEAMYTKIKQGGTSYDLAVPSDYMIQKMKRENLLLPLDHSKLTGLKNYDPRFMNLSFDRHNKYSLPYFFWHTRHYL